MGVVDHLFGMYYEVESRRLKNSVAEHIVYGWQEEPTQVTIQYAGKEQEQPLPASPFDGVCPF